jgi:Divergent InlB B-repeat domain
MKLLITAAGVTAIIAMLIGGSSKNSLNHVTPAQNSLILIRCGSGKGNIFLTSGEKLSDGNRFSIKKQEGSKITLRAEAASGSRFVGWEGPCKGQASSCTIIVGSQTQITATFNAIRD